MPYQNEPGINSEDRPSRSWWSSFWSRPDKLAKETELPVRENNEGREDDGSADRNAEARRLAKEAELPIREDNEDREDDGSDAARREPIDPNARA